MKAILKHNKYSSDATSLFNENYLSLHQAMNGEICLQSGLHFPVWQQRSCKILLSGNMTSLSKTQVSEELLTTGNWSQEKQHQFPSPRPGQRAAPPMQIPQASLWERKVTPLHSISVTRISVCKSLCTSELINIYDDQSHPICTLKTSS